MKLPLQITVRNMEPSNAAETHIREKLGKLEEHYKGIISCRVMVEAPHRHKNKGGEYNIRIDLKVPGKEIVVKKVSDPDIYIAIRDAFNALRRRMDGVRRRQRQEVKTHEETPRGKVVSLFPAEDYGFLETEDGREVYFHRNSVLNGGFERISTGTEVRFVEEMGEEGPQASTVTVTRNPREENKETKGEIPLPS
ncbi:MAG TPA: HPF/RaiA family ribosome-associated protein [Nitrospiria bacterium]|nr:HPF/RaiA family ribosome-associated protein [Nitrospiria bacterium]